MVTFWWVNLIKFPPYVALGMFNADTAQAVLLLAPVGVVGVRHRRLGAPARQRAAGSSA